MTKKHTESINKLDDELVNLYNDITNSDMEFNYIYGSGDDTLVVISTHKGGSKDFRELISKSILDTLDKPCGFVLADGPSDYEEYTTAYIRKNPDKSYEYVLAPCMRLVDENDITTIFGQMNALSKDDEENPRVMAAAYLYALLVPEVEIKTVSSIMGVEQDKIRDNALDAQERIQDVLYD